MSDRKYNVICSDDCFFESMTKEQILAAIAEATGSTPTDVDAAFITKIREMNASDNLTFWIGTTAEYNAITEKVPSCFYILTDDTTEDDLMTAIEQLQNANKVNAENIDALMKRYNNNGALIYDCGNNDDYLTTGKEIDLNGYKLIQVEIYPYSSDPILCLVKRYEHSNGVQYYVGGSKRFKSQVGNLLEEISVNFWVNDTTVSTYCSAVSIDTSYDDDGIVTNTQVTDRNITKIYGIM